MTYRNRTDANQAEIARALTAAGCTVLDLTPLRHGADLLVGACGRNYLLEVKDGAKWPSRRRLTPNERDFHLTWRGQITVVESADQALRTVFGEGGIG